MLSGMWIWLIIGLALMALEMLVGTFVLLVLGLSSIMAALFAAFNADLSWQLVAFSVTALVGGLLLRRRKYNSKPEVEQDLDVGQMVQVVEVRPDGSARVMYRGAQWSAVSESGEPLQVGHYRILAVQGAQLVLATDSFKS